MARAREDYQRRRAALKTSCARRACRMRRGDGLNQDSAAGGRSGRALAMARRGWLLRHGEAFCVQEPVPGLRVTLSDIEPEQCAQLARDLRQSIAWVAAHIARALRRDMRHAAAIASSSISSRSWPQNSSPA